MMVVEYLIKCPYCFSDTKVVLERANPVMYMCHGCRRVIVIQGKIIYTMPYETVRDILDKYPNKTCGRLLGSYVSPIAKEKLKEKKTVDLHALLEQNIDVNDFIKKLG